MAEVDGQTPAGRPTRPPVACELSDNDLGVHSVGWFYGVPCEYCGQRQPRNPAKVPRHPAKIWRKRLRRE